MHSVKTAKYIEGYKILLTFEDGAKKACRFIFAFIRGNF